MRIEMRDRVIHRDAFVPFTGFVVSVETQQFKRQREAIINTEALLGPAYHCTLTTMSSASQGEEGASYNPAESTSMTLNKVQLTEYIKLLEDHRDRMAEQS